MTQTNSPSPSGAVGTFARFQAMLTGALLGALLMLACTSGGTPSTSVGAAGGSAWPADLQIGSTIDVRIHEDLINETVYNDYVRITITDVQGPWVKFNSAAFPLGDYWINLDTTPCVFQLVSP